MFTFLFDPFQRLGQKLWQFFRDIFGGIEAKKNCFWDFLTFIEHQRKNIFRYFLSDMDIEMLLLHIKSGFFFIASVRSRFSKNGFVRSSWFLYSFMICWVDIWDSFNVQNLSVCKEKRYLRHFRENVLQ